MTTTGTDYDQRITLGIDQPPPPEPGELLSLEDLAPEERESVALKVDAIKRQVNGRYPGFWQQSEAYWALPEGSQERRDYRYRNPGFEAASNFYNLLLRQDPVLGRIWKTWFWDHWAGYGNADVAGQRLAGGGGVFRSINYQDGTPRPTRGSEWGSRGSSSGGGSTYPPRVQPQPMPQFDTPRIKQWQQNVPDLWVKGRFY